jgi:hypothetical protein
MCKEMPVIPVNKVVDPKIWRAKEEERHKGSLTQKTLFCVSSGKSTPNMSSKTLG